MQSNPKTTEPLCFFEKIANIQANLSAPKDQYNDFNKFKYRNLEAILVAAKPLLDGLVLTITDEMLMVGERYYIKATATITDGEKSLSNTAFAREEENKKGMDSAQVSGSTSSYARKYAVAGLFLCDDNKDPDSMDNSQPQQNVQAASKKHIKLGYAIQEHFQSIAAIKESVFNGDLGLAAEAWGEIPEDDRMALSVAPTKGGVWTKEEKKVFMSDEWSAARKATFED